jgi:hypothetical protein
MLGKVSLIVIVIGVGYVTRNRYSLRHCVKKVPRLSLSNRPAAFRVGTTKPEKVFYPANFLWIGRAAKLAAGLRYGTG